MSTKKESPRSTKHSLLLALALTAGVGGLFTFVYIGLPALFSISYAGNVTLTSGAPPQKPAPPPLNTAAYDKKLLALAHVATSTLWYAEFTGATTTATSSPRHLWPVKTAYPLGGALLPFNRIVAYYGNFYSTGMGVLGEYPESEVISKLQTEVAKWEAADPNTPVIPAIEYIDVTAQAGAGKDGKYRARMPDDQIDKAIAMAAKVHGIVILDIQVGLSTLSDELPLLSTYFAMPQVHLAIDPEFSMHDGARPGTVIGSFDAVDINYAAQFLAKLVKENNLPPKILVVHRFTEGMVTNYQNIQPLPEVQLVMQMDGWGFPAKKINTYNVVIWPEPVQFTGFKLFYKNDIKQIPPLLMTPQEVLNLTPSPSFIQYQ